MDTRWKHNFSALVSGPSLSGKSTFVRQLLQLGAEMIDGVPEKILYCYGAYQPMFDEMKNEIPNIYFIEGLPNDLFDMVDSRQRNLLILDDLMADVADNKMMTQLFTKGRHDNLSIIFIVHNLFYQGKEMRNVSLNASYIVVFRSPRDKTQIMNLAKQMYPGNSKFMLEAYENATEKPYGYLVIDLRSNTPEEFRLRTNIFPGDPQQYAYVRRDYKLH